jgi:hypothetical protein
MDRQPGPLAQKTPTLLNPLARATRRLPVGVLVVPLSQ